MEYRIDITDPALPGTAERWFRGLVEARYSLETMPERRPMIPEQPEFRFEIRHLLYGSHRIIFAVESEEEVVVIYRIYHGARRPLSAVIRGSGLAAQAASINKGSN